MPDTIRSLSDLQTLLANNTTNEISAQDIRDFLVSVDPDNHKTTGTWASRPATPRKGDIYFATDAPLLSVAPSDNNWLTWGPIFNLTPPNLTGFNWNNQGNATLTQRSDLTVLETQGNAGVNLQQYLATAPTPPFSLTIGFKFHPQASTSTAGIAIRQSSDDKIMTFHILFTTGAFVDISRFTNSTTFSSNAAISVLAPNRIFTWFRYRDDSTNRYFEFSNNGIDWIIAFQETRTTFLTANQVGFFINNQNSKISKLLLYHLVLG